MPANSLGTLSPTVVTLDTIAFLKKTFPVITAISTDFSADATLLNEQVISRVVTPPPTHDYSAPSGGGTGYAPQDAATTTDVPVRINKHKFATWPFPIRKSPPLSVIWRRSRSRLWLMPWADNS
jgi:hypothetical protein